MYTDLIAELLNQSDKQRYAAIAQSVKLGHSKASEFLSHLEAVIPKRPPGGSYFWLLWPQKLPAIAHLITWGLPSTAASISSAELP